MRANWWPMPHLRPSVVVLLVGGLLACSQPAADPDPVGDTLARFEGGSITAERLNQAILALPAESRPKDPAEREAWYEELVRRLAIHDLLVAQGRRDGLPAEPEIAERIRETHKQMLGSAFIARQIVVPAPGAEEEKQFYEARGDALRSPERREVLHIFLRPAPGESRDALRARLEALRARSLAGEPFALLAREYSESQLRHDDGVLGWVTPGQLPPRLNDIVFGLEEGVPSEVLMTESGAHLFLASTVVAERMPSLAEARSEIRRSLYLEGQNEALAAFLEAHERAPGDFAPSAEELSALLAGGDPAALVQRVGDWTLTLGELLERFDSRRRGQRRPGSEGDQLFALLESIARGERVYQLALAAGLAEQPEMQQALAAAEDDIVVMEMQRRKLLDRLTADPEVVRAFFEERKRRFAGPLRLRVARLAVPVGAGSGRILRRLEEAGPGLRSGEETLEALAARVGGTVHEPEWRSLADLRAEGGRLRGRLAAVPEGGFSEPVSTGREIEIFHVIERSEPEVPEFESVRDAVHAAYLQIHGEALYAAFVEDELAQSGFEIVPGSLARFAAQAAGVGDAELETE